MASEALLRPLVLGPIVLLAATLLWKLVSSSRYSRLPDGIPIIGVSKPGWFAMVRARWHNTMNYAAVIMDVYARHRNTAVVLPIMSMTRSGNVVVLPASEAQWVTDQPDSVLDFRGAAEESLQLWHTAPDSHITIKYPLHDKIITTTLTGQIGNLLQEMTEEAAWVFDRHWGHVGGDTDEYREVCVFKTVQRMVGGVANRAFVGLPHCRDPTFLDTCIAFAQDIPLASILLRHVWVPLRPLLALLFTMPNRMHARRFVRLLRPEIEARLRSREDEARREKDAGDRDVQANGSENLGSTTGRHNDFLEWIIQQALETGDPRMVTPRTLALRILLVNFAAIHTTSFTLTRAILDLVACKPEDVDELRAEAESVLREEGGRWTKRGLARLEKLDSCLRESARHGSIVTIGLRRNVVAPSGLTTPSGVHLPYGAEVAVPSLPVFHDEGLYGADQATFDPFRFYKRRHSAANKGNHVQGARNAFSATSPDYLAFGHGRHACPGRFFATAELKVMLAHMLIHYDIEKLDQRPPDRWMGFQRIPPMKATIRIRRRKLAAPVYAQ